MFILYCSPVPAALLSQGPTLYVCILLSDMCLVCIRRFLACARVCLGLLDIPELRPFSIWFHLRLCALALFALLNPNALTIVKLCGVNFGWSLLGPVPTVDS